LRNLSRIHFSYVATSFPRSCEIKGQRTALMTARRVPLWETRLFSGSCITARKPERENSTRQTTKVIAP
jgi:hypothetical protein